MGTSTYRRFDLESLEQRLLLSADGFGAGMLNLAAENPSVKHEIVVEVQADTNLRTDFSEGEESIFGDFEVDVVFDDVHSDSKEGMSHDGADSSAAAIATKADEKGSEISGEKLADSQLMALNGEMGPHLPWTLDGRIDDAKPTGLEGSGNPMPDILTETLHNANGPPANQVAAGTPGSEHIVNLNLGNAQINNNQLVINEGEILKGTWTAPVDLVVNGGRVSPGNSPGIQNVATFTQTNGETEFEIASAGGPGIGFDQINVTGLATLGGSARMRITLLGGYVPSVGQTFTIMTWGSHAGEFENYLGTAAIGSDRAFVPSYNAGSLVLTVVATPGYNPVQAQIENLINTLGTVGNTLDTAGDLAENLPFIGDNVGGLVATGSAIQGVLLDKLNDLSGTLSIADVTAYLEGLDGTVLLGYTMHVEGVIATFGATIAAPFGWEYDIYFTRTDTVNYDLGDDIAFGGTLAAAATGSVTSRFDLDFSFGQDATGYYVGLDEVKACIALNTAPSLTLNFSSPLSAGVTANGTATLNACIGLVPNSSILTGGKIYLSNLTGLGNGSSSVITNFTWTPTASINVDLQLSFTSITFAAGVTLSSGGVNGRLKINGANLFSDAPDVDIDFTGANVTLSLGASLPSIQGNFDINTDGGLTYIDVQITHLLLTAGGTRLMDLAGNASLVVGDGTLAGKADLTLGAGPLVPNLTLTGGAWHFELNTGNTVAEVPYNGGTATIPAGPYLRVEADSVGVGFTINPTFTLTGNFVFEKSGANVVVGASDVEFKFTDGTNDLMSLTDGFGGFRVTSAGIAGVLGGTFSETIPVVDVSGTFEVEFNTTGAAVSTTITVNGGSVIIDVPAGNYLRIQGVGVVMDVLGVGLTGDFVFENRETSTGGERVITVAATNVEFELGDASTGLVSLSNGSGAFIITNTGVAGTATVHYALDVLGLASASGAGTLVINQINSAVNETVVIGAGSVPIIVPAGPYLRVETTGATLTVLDSVVTGNFSYEQKTTGDGNEVVAVAATNVSVSLKQGGVTLLSLTNGSGFFVFNDDGMAGVANGTVAESIADIVSLTGTFALTINTTANAVSEDFTIGVTNHSIDVPAGPYLKITGDSVSLVLSFAGIGSVTVTGSFGFEQKLDAGHVAEYVKVGATGVGLVATAGGITLTVTGAEGGFIIKDVGVAGEVSIPDSPGLQVTGLPEISPGVPVVTFAGSNMKLRLNTTGADVPSTTVSTSSTGDVTFNFTGLYYRNYLGISGSVVATFAGFADFSGDLSFEIFNPGSGNIIRLAATSLSISFNMAGGASLMSFDNGTGAFEISSAGVAGIASLDFQTGFVNVSGTILLELNTTSSAQSRSWSAPDGTPFSFNLTSTNYLRVCVNGHLVLGAVDIPVNFAIFQSGGNLVFQTKGVSPQEIFRFDSSGAFIPGLYWTNLGISNIDFANPSPEDILTFLQRLGNWFNLLGGSSLFDIEIPFSGGKTLGEAVDWVSGFVDFFYNKLVSSEIAALSMNLPATNPFAGSFKVSFGSVSTTFTVNFNGNYNAGLTGVINSINAGIAAAGLTSRIQARLNRDGVLSIALTEAEMDAGTLNFTISNGTGAFTLSSAHTGLGFSASGSSQTISAYTIEDFPHALFVLGITSADIPYDEHRKLYEFPIDIAVGTAADDFNVNFDFGQEIGPLGEATLTGTMKFSPRLHFTFDLGLDLNAAEVPRIPSSQFIPVPSNGRITTTTSFKLYLNGAALPITVTLTKASTNDNFTVTQLETDLNNALSAAPDYTPAGGVPTDLLQFVRFQAAGNVLVLSAVNEDFDNDGHRDVAEDANGNHQLDAGEDLDGDGNLDVAEPDWDTDGVLDNQLGLINQIRITVGKNDAFATELGFGDVVHDVAPGYPDGYFESTANSSMKGFFLDNVGLRADLTITTPANVTGQIVFGFLKLSVTGGKVESRDIHNVPSPISTKIGIRDPTNGNTRFYLPQLMDVLTDIGTYFSVELTGGLYAGFSGISGFIGSNMVLSGGEISVWIPVLTQLTLNENPYNIDDVRTDNDAGIFLTYPNVGLGGGFSFSEISFTDILHGLQAVVDTLDDFSAFSFLDEKIPFLDLSLHDLVDYAGQFADLVDAVAGVGASNIQDLLDQMETSIETLFHLSPNSFDILFDTNGINYAMGVGSDVLTHTGGPGARSRVTFDPTGPNNAFTITRTVVGGEWNNSTLRIKGDSSVSGNLATASWDPVNKIITVLIDPANTLVSTIVSAINTQIGANWTAAMVGGNDGSVKVRTNAIKFHWNFTAAYADEIPLHLDIAELLGRLGGDNPQVQAFLAAATSILHVEGNGLLNVSASASAILDFGLDLTDPSTVTPFLYDTTSVDVKAKVSIKNLEFQASIGALGVFIRNGEVVFDYDGKGGSTDSAIIRLGLVDRDGDGRHWFDSSLLSLDSIGVTAHAGITGVLPLYAPVDSLPVGSTTDANGDGFADNALAVDIPDLVRLLMGDTTALNVSSVEESVLLFRGSANDLKLTVSAASGLHGVKITFSDTGSLSATYNSGSKEIIFGIDSGVTTALQLVNFVIANGITSAPAGAFTLALVPGNDPVANPSASPPVVAVPNNGAGKLAKVSVAAPDLGNLFGDMDLCEIIDSATGPLLDGLDGTLGDIQNALEEVVLNTDLPLLGDGLKGAASFIEDFRNGLLAELRARIAAANGSAIGAIEDAIKEAFWNTLGPGGLGLLVDPTTGNAFAPDASFDVLDVTLSCDDGLVANLRLRKSLALLDTTQNPIDFDIGVPGFGLKVDGNVVLAIAFDLKLRFGFNKSDGFYLNTEGGMDDPELKLDFSATIPGLHAAGELFFLQLDVSDDAVDSSYFTGGFYVDLKDPNHDNKLTWAELTSAKFEDIIEGELAAHANLNLDIAASFSGNANFPRLLADFHLGWNWTLSDGSDDPVIEFDNLRLDLGTFISNVLGPILEEVQKITEPIQPIIDIATFELPVLSTLAGKPITFLDLAQAFGYLDPETREFIEQVLQVIEFINSIPTGSGSIYIPLGSFLLDQSEDGSYGSVNPLGNLSNIDLGAALNSLGDDSTAGSTQITQTSGFVSDIGSMDNFKLPWLDNPSELFGLFTGQPVRLVEWQMPTFAFEFTYTQKIPIYPPLYAQFGGTIGAYINIGFGFDTKGIQEFIEGGAKHPEVILDGFYIADWDAEGNERPELVLKGEIFAGVSLSIGPVEVGVQGGIGATIEFDLNDIVEDGRVRISELIANAKQDPRCIFDIHGRLYLFLEAFLKIDLLFFKIDKTWRFGEFTLFEFDITCPQPVLAHVDGTTLYIHIGERADLREEIDTSDGNETFVIAHLEGAGGGTETVEVRWGDYKQPFSGFTDIVVDAGEGNDYVDFTGVLSKVTVDGGAGDDTILLGLGNGTVARGGDGDDTITAGSDDGVSVTGVTLEGGAGNDILTGVKTAIIIHGDDGTDKIYGTPGNDTLDGGGGTDLIYAYAGDDDITGGTGNDTIYADTGRDKVDAGDGNDIVEGGSDDDRIMGGAGNDLLYGGDGNDVISGGVGDDQIFGHGGKDLLVGDDFNMAAWTQPMTDNLANYQISGGVTQSFALLNITGSGNDMIVGGGSYDVMFGGDGDDVCFGGNFFSGGTTQVIEEDDNDFIDGGRGNDQIFGDDSFGKTGDRITGISIEGLVFNDVNPGNLYDDGDRGLAGVKVQLFKASDDSLFSETVSDSAGRWKLLGLDPLDYYLKFTGPTGYTLVTPNAGSALGLDDPAEPDNDSDAAVVTGRTGAFRLDYDEAETTITAGYFGKPVVTITNAAVNERGDGQSASAVFTVTLSVPSAATIKLDYHTLDGLALAADHDYTAVLAGLLTFAPGEVSRTITVNVTGDSTYERHEDFKLVVVPRDPTQLDGAPASFTVTQTIINDDALPTISINDVIVSEPVANGGTTSIRFTVRLSNYHYNGVTVMYQTTDATLIDGSASGHSATAVNDYTPLSALPPLNFGPGELEKIVTVVVKGDNIDEYDETFYVNLFNATNASIADDRGYGVILDTDTDVTVAITPSPVIADGGLDGQSATIPEGNYITQAVLMNVTLTGATEKTVTVRWDVARGTALADFDAEINDFENNARSDSDEPSDTDLVFAPGDPSMKQITVWVHGDLLNEGNEYFYVNLLTADGAKITKNHVTVNITDDDAANSTGSPFDVHFARNQFIETETDGLKIGYVTLVRTPGPAQAYVVLTVTGGTAVNFPGANADYSQTARLLVVFPAGENVVDVPILILGDTRNEFDETITFDLRQPTGAPVSGTPGAATMTIIDDDDVSVMVTYNNGAGVNEGNAGFSGHSFSIQLVDAETHLLTTSEKTITFQYSATGITATSGVDFTATGTVNSSFLPFVNTMVVPVNAIGDFTPEFQEVFRLSVKNVVGAGTYFPFADAVILDDDPKNVTGYLFKDTNNNGYWDSGELPFVGAQVTITEQNGTVHTPVITDGSGRYSTSVFLGTLSLQVNDTAVLSGWEVTTDNDSQTGDFDGGNAPFTDVGYRFTVNFEFPKSADTVGRGGTDDTLFGGPGDDYIDAGAGDDHIVGGHWQVATDSNAPINMGSYNATIIANKGANILDPQTAPIWTVNTSVDAGTASVEGNIFVDTNNSSRQDEGLYTGEVIVTLLDCSSNIINIVATTTGSYKFSRLYAGTYYIQFSLPAGQQFVAPNLIDDIDDSDAEFAGSTKQYVFAAGEVKKNVDAGLEDAGTLPVASSSTVSFAQPEWHVSDTDPLHKVVITLVRSNASQAEALVWFASNGTAVSPTNYTVSQGVVIFAAGETLATFEIPIVFANLDPCDVLDFHLSLNRPTGQPIKNGSATVYIHGKGAATNTDNDTILGGENWDTEIGDSGHINSNAVQAASANGQIQDFGGLGHDFIYGDDGPDYLNGQLGNDVLAGGEGNDYVYAGYGNDRLIAELDDDELHGDHGTDRVAGTSPLPYITLTGGVVPALLSFGKAPVPALPTLPDPADSLFKLFDIESAELFGTSGNDLFQINSWSAEAWIFGDDGSDTIRITSDLPSVAVSDATAGQKFIYLFFFGFDVDANVILSTGPAYHFGQMETVWLTGGPSANTLDASGYSSPVILEGLGGPDTIIGGSAGDTFLFDTDAALGTDTVTGNGGIDMLNFSSTSNLFNVQVDLANIGGTQIVNANLSLVLTVEDIEGVTGGDGSDDLKGNNLDNILIGGPGNDTLTGRGGSETYRYDTDTVWGSDTIVENGADPGHDTIDFSDTTTEIISLNLGLAGSQVVTVGKLTLTISGTGIDEVVGGSRDDVITGNTGNNTLRGGPGNDKLFGAAGNDFLDGGPGTDTLDGGLGSDSISAIANSNFTLTDSQLLRNGSDVDFLYSINSADLTGGASNNVFNLTGWSGNATIDGMGGSDTILFTVDADMILSTAGPSDVLDVNFGAYQFTVQNIELWTLAGGVSANVIDAGAYTRSGALTLSGNGGADIIVGSLNDDLLLGGPGDDTITGNGGFDTILGGTGTDKVSESGFTSLFVTSTGLSINRAATGAETDSLDSIETITAAGAANALYAFTGFISGLTSVTFTGAGAVDIVGIIWNGTLTATNTLISLTGAPPINLVGMERLIMVGGTGNDILDSSGFSGLSSLSGADGDDVLIGGTGTDSLVGGEGNDSLTGGGGNDTLNGGNGDDTYVFDTDNVLGTDTIVDSEGTDTLNFSASALGNNVNLTLLANPVNANLTLNWAAGVALENIIGGSGADNLTGTALSNVLTGGGGGDTLNGGAGDDTYVFDVDFLLGSDNIIDSAGVDKLDFSSTTGVNLTVNLTVAAGQVVNAPNLTLTLGAAVIENVTAGDGSDNITGNGFDNVLIGGRGIDNLSGNNGADTLDGGDGNDILTGGAGNDIYVFNAGIAQGADTLNDASGIDTLDLSATAALGVTVDLGVATAQVVRAVNLTITLGSATAFENVIGGGGNDIVRGNTSVNVFTGGAGSDTIIGVGAGDTLLETRDANFVLADGLAGTGTLTIGAEVDNLTNIHTAILTGGVSNNFIDVRDFTGTATLNGGLGNDTLYGGGGTMNLIGGSGDDTYVFDRSVDSVNTITEGSGLLDDLHDTIMGAGGALVDLTIASLQVPDAAHPNFKIQFTTISTVEHTL